ncbi:non-ribosomal peptide synthetase [Pseudoramibacter alactolyticus]|uniref:non-ribosomal peptide synthetase n=1 Tax=Pseudoramibacter alactolyticus TaxID=113287 RepID=UPI00248E7C12|nr:non-ribosomal peptide synthetase [Pseudoramibacter alactolyticus]
MNNRLSFPMTNAQLAYYMGRSQRYALGDTAAHVYYEFKNNLDADLLERALNFAIRRHAMLRTVFHDNGMQQILEETAPYHIQRYDLSASDDAAWETFVSRKRAVLSHEKMDPEQWPLFRVEAAKTPDGSTYLFFSFDLLIADGSSLILVFRSIMDYYDAIERGELPSVQPDLRFAEYAMWQNEIKQSEKYRRDRKYWESRAEDLCFAPDLLHTEAVPKKKQYKRLIHQILPKQWEIIKQQIRKNNEILTSVLFELYGEVLAYWSGDERFTIALTMSNRGAKRGRYLDVVGDFTSLMLLPYENTAQTNIYSRAHQVTKELMAAYRHSGCDGFEVERIISRQRKQQHENHFDIVFTSMLDESDANGMPMRIGRLMNSISQTPQVRLDCQLLEIENKLEITWDYLDGYYREENMTLAFSQYIKMIERLAVSGQRLVLSPDAKTAEAVRAYNATKQPELPHVSMIPIIENALKKFANKTAFKDSRRSITFQELDIYSEVVKNAILAEYPAGSHIAIKGNRSISTVIYIVGVIRAGCVYIPIHPDYPADRVSYICDACACGLYFDCDFFDGKLYGAPVSAHEGTAPVAEDSSAYIIYTSGSTGLPKGVEITHGQLCNTIFDMNARLGLESDDVLLNVSAFSFDLSVFDVFSGITSGACVYIADDARDIRTLKSVLHAEQVTILNGVPSVVQLITEQSEEETYRSLRYVLMSGDFIPLTLPEALAKICPNAELLSLGGATEATIWSIAYPIDASVRYSESIPYGYPLANQTCYVLDKNLQLCPAGVKGTIFIGGRGVAKGYHRDDERTRAAFIQHHQYGRLYNTGDLGVFTSEGFIRILGRKDGQVKVNGFRVETGEIEKTLMDSDKVNSAAVIASGAALHKQLIGYIVPHVQNHTALPEEAGRTLQLLCDRCREVEAPDVAEFNQFAALAEKTATAHMKRIILQLCKESGLGDDFFTPELLVRRSAVKPGYTKLMRQWLKNLAEDGSIDADHDCYCVARLQSVSDAEMDALIREAASVAGNPAFFLNTIKYGIDILKGEKEALTYLFPDGDFGAAEAIYRGNDISRYFNELAAEAVFELVKSMLSRSDGAVRILEIGAGVGGTTQRIVELLAGLPEERIAYTFTDLSQYFLSEAKKHFSSYPFMQYRLFDIDKAIPEQRFGYESFDVVIAANVMHDARDVDHAMTLTTQLLAPGGVMVMLETTTDSRIQMVSTHMIEGYNHYEDFRVAACAPLIAADEWEQVMKRSGYAQTAAFPQRDAAASVFGEHLILGMRGSKRNFLTETELAQLKEDINGKLPPYMLPAHLIQLGELPLTVNGKVNKSMLPAASTHAKGQNEHKHPKTQTEQRIFSVWQEMLGTENFGITDNLFAIGGDSIMMVRMTAILEKQYGYKLSLNDFLTHATVKALAELIDSSDSADTAQSYAHDEANAYAPFPLTSVQLAYLVGGSQNQGMESITTQAYYELKTSWDIDQLQRAVNQVIKQQPMLHAVVSENGTQRILSDYPEFVIRRHQYHSDDDVVAIRKRLEGRPIDPHRYPMFEMESMALPDGDHYLFLHFNLLIADGMSMQIMIRQLYDAYYGNKMCVDHDAFTFRDYVCCRSNLLKEGIDREDAEYWRNIMPDLAPAPPIADKPETEIINPHFRRLRTLIPKTKWQWILSQIAENQTTAASYLLTMYSKVLGYWSGTQAMTINVTTFDRMPLSDNVNRIIGDFTTLVLVPVVLEKASLWDQVRRVQRQILQSIGHARYDGIRVMRDYRERVADPEKAKMPVVFTSMLFSDHGKSFEKTPGKVCYSVSQTPQVHLDCQVMENAEGLSVTWDFVDELFEPEKIKSMFAQFEALICSGADGVPDDGILQPLPEFIEAIDQYNSTESATGALTLKALIEAGLKQAPDLVAISDDTGSMTYRELDERTGQLAAKLQRCGAGPGALVAVECRKDLETVVRLLAVARSGAAYVPLDQDYPMQRKQTIIDQSGCRLIMRAGTDDIVAAADKAGQEASEDLAYVIYTSGSTGTPKGVEISQSAIINTLLDMRERMELTSRDVFAVITSFCFDLSVFDLFESILLHAHLVVILDSRNIRQTARMLTEQGVTVINCVPATAELIVDHMTEQNHTVRTVLLSGDFIPPGLPEKIMKKMPNAKVWSLGGATEAAVWSIAYPITRDYDRSQHIPYGYPLTNQTCYVLDEMMRLCPRGVTGEICIGGRGVALGYRNAPELTKTAFRMHPRFGRIYRTGDLGKADADGCIHILGRKDHQIKINGFRVETGEIEHVLEESRRIERAVVVYDKGQNSLTGYIKPAVRPVNAPEIWRAESLFDEMRMASNDRIRALMTGSDEAHMRRANQSVINQMKQVIYELIAEGRVAQPFTLASFFDQTGVRKIYAKLMRQWFAILIREGFMDCDGQRYSLLYDASLLKDWHVGLGAIQTAIGDITFISQCRENLKEILLGKVDVLQLLFPDGKMAAAEELYKSNQISAHYNKLTADVIGRYVGAVGEPASVMEMGAGTGATSAGVIEKIQESCREYLFTDVSDFFTDAAREKFKTYSFMKYQNYDINRSPCEQGYPYEQHDVILAANVMHDAVDVKKSLEYAASMIKPGGVLVLQEMTRTSLIQLVSTRMIEGYSDFNDFRLEKNSPILDAKEWASVLKAAGFETVFCFPDAKIESDLFGEHIIFAGKPAVSCYLNKAQLQDETKRIRDKLPAYMMPSAWMQLRAFPLTYNQKVDLKALPQPSQPEKKSAAFAQPETQEEKFLWELWRRQLGHTHFGVTDDFFLVGGDSLKAIKTIAEINERYSLEMTAFFESPDIRHIAAKMQSDGRVIREKLSALYGRMDGQAVTPPVDAADEWAQYEKKISEDMAHLKLKNAAGSNENILLFGATGYLGCYLLRSLLKNVPRDITVIVRSANDAAAAKRVAEGYRFYFGDAQSKAAAQRIHAVSGDFTQPRFGLKPERYDKLANTITCVINTAAMVKHQGVYEAFYQTNVRSVANIIQFASTGIPKTVHHVSSNGIMFGAYPDGDNRTLFTEYDCDRGQTFTNYYLRSKFEAEKIIMQARQTQGMNINIYRAGSIMFDSSSGHFQRNMAENTAYMFFRAFKKMGIAPADLDFSFDITFVDQLADAMTRIILSGVSLNDVYHMVNPNRANLSEVFRHGLVAKNLRPMNFSEVCEFFERHFEDETYRPYIQDVLYNCEMIALLNRHAKQLTTRRTERLLKKLGFNWRPVSDEMIARAMHYAEKAAYI